jgi:ribonuclease T1
MSCPLTGRIPALFAACCVALATLLPAAPASSRSTADDLPSIAVAELPPEGRQVLALIRQGGPFSHDRDGVTFGNRERLLPAKPRGHYREYTVRTPGVGHRGARRIVCGGPPGTPEACYYTADHYASFKKIRE